MVQNNENNIFISEQITIIKPLKAHKIFDEERFEKIETYDKEGGKLVILREKIIKE